MSNNSIPIVNLSVEIDSVNDDYVNASIEIVDYKLRNENTRFSVTYDCLLKYRGASSVNYTKKPFAIKFVDSNGNGKDINILGMRADDNWILDAMSIDQIRMRNRVCFDIWNQISKTPYATKYDNRNGTVGCFVEVFINGDYQGLYCLMDKINRKLLGIKKADVINNIVDPKGVIYKGVNWNTGYDLLSYEEQSMDSVMWNAFQLDYPEDYPSAKVWIPLNKLITFCSDATDNDEFLQKWQNYFYKENIIQYQVFAIALYISDNLYKNTYLSIVDITKDQHFLITPWDMDMTLGRRSNGEHFNFFSKITRYDTRAPYNRLSGGNLDNYMDDVRDYWMTVRENQLSVEHVHQLLDNYADMFEKSGAWEREYEKWNGDPVPLTPTIWEQINKVKAWYSTNFETVNEQFEALNEGIISPLQNTDDQTIYDTKGRKINGDLYKLPENIYIINRKKYLLK